MPTCTLCIFHAHCQIAAEPLHPAESWGTTLILRDNRAVMLDNDCEFVTSRSAGTPAHPFEAQVGNVEEKTVTKSHYCKVDAYISMEIPFSLGDYLAAV